LLPGWKPGPAAEPLQPDALRPARDPAEGRIAEKSGALEKILDRLKFRKGKDS
jgi:hypothetical protein